MKTLAALPLLALAGCSVCQPTRFTWPVFDDPIAALILESDSGSERASENGPSAISAPPSASTGTPSASTETPSAPSEPDAETPATQTPPAPSTNDGVGGQQETREESHDRG